MPVLGIDTSAAVAVSLTDDDGALLAGRSALQQRRHAELLAPMIVEVLAEARVDRTALARIVVGTGPAPFTGLRVGLVTARTLALALGIPVHGVCTLDALAAQAARELGLAHGAEVLVTTDARRREVYWARYGLDPTGLRPTAGPGVARAGWARDEGLAAAAVVVGRGALLHPEALEVAVGAPLDPDPATLVRLALARLAAGEAELPTEPMYLRRPDAVPPSAPKRVLA